MKSSRSIKNDLRKGNDGALRDCVRLCDALNMDEVKLSLSRLNCRC